MSMPPRPCQRSRVATRGAITIDTCTCGTIHLNAGSTTLRFTGDGFEELAELVLEALFELGARRHPLEPRLSTRRLRGEA